MTSSPQPLTLLKLGGSLITDKTRPQTPRLDVIQRLAEEISTAFKQAAGLRLVLGHGSGSFGHYPASRYGTRQGVHTPEEWRGFVEVWQAANALNRLVMDALLEAGLPALAFPASASLLARDGQVLRWDLGPLQSALEEGLLPVIYGDVVFDQERGGTILSTEDLFGYLAKQLHAQRLLLAGRESGVWADFPACTRLVPEITPSSLVKLSPSLGGSGAVDVTGGMLSKVHQALELVQTVPGLQAWIFSGETPGLVKEALSGAGPGTHLQPDGR